MEICIYIYKIVILIYSYIYIHIHIIIFIYIYTYTYIYIYIEIYNHICMYNHTFIYDHIHVFVLSIHVYEKHMKKGSSIILFKEKWATDTEKMESYHNWLVVEPPIWKRGKAYLGHHPIGVKMKICETTNST